tara:strand:- start:16250 stop:16783 length:534 start_codon:yes stop_codon:yes gene_type:complete
MKKLLFIKLIIIISCKISFGQVIVVVDQPIIGSINYCATSKVLFLPGVSYSPNVGERMQAYISPDCGSYVLLNQTLDGGYYNASHKEVRFQYDEEYETTLYKKLAYKIYDKDKNLVGGVDMNSVPLVAGSQLLSNNIGENKFRLNFFSLSLTINEYYTLEVSNDKNEKKVLKFKVYN